MSKHIENVVIGFPILSEELAFANDFKDWERIEKEKTFYTSERFLPNIMLELGIVSSKGEIRRNKPELMTTLNSLDFVEIKWGKSRLFILVGFDTLEERDEKLKQIESE